MASTYSARLKLELMEAGANTGTWGNNTNENLQVIDALLEVIFLKILLEVPTLPLRLRIGILT